MDLTSQDINTDITYLNFINKNEFKLDIQKIQVETANDLILKQIFNFVKNGWPNSVTDEYKAYFVRKHEITIENEILMWGYRVIC